MKCNNLFSLILCMLSLLLTLFFVELSLYLFYPIKFFKPPPKLPNNIWQELLHRTSSIPGLAYELVPNQEKLFQRTIIRTNSHGMRDNEPRPKEDMSVYRIMILGDSYTFGLGVDGEDTYPSILEIKLNERYKNNSIDVLNFGVVGYSTQDEALVLEKKGLSWNPNILIIGYVLNDPEIAPVEELHSYYTSPSWWQYSNLFRLIAKSKYIWDLRRLGNGDYVRYLHSPQRAKWKSVVKAFEKIHTTVKCRNITVLVIIFPMLKRSWSNYINREQHYQVAKAALQMGFYVIDLYDEYSLYPIDNLRVSSSDAHPNELGHKIAANVIYGWILENEKILGIALSINQ